MNFLNLHHILAEGRLEAAPEYTELESGMPRTTFIIKDLENKTGYKFLKIVTWSAVAETCARYLAAGHPVRVRGRVDKAANGETVFLIAQAVEFLPRV